MELPMSQARSSMAPLLAIVWWAAAAPLALVGAGCARKPPARADQALAPASTLPVTLHVSNSNWSDVRIYLVRGGAWLRLGLVTTNGAADFEIPPDFLRQAGSVILVAAPVAGRAAYSTSLAGIMPGDEVELVVEGFLQYSHLVVR
jgi:hypothetical protein